MFVLNVWSQCVSYKENEIKTDLHNCVISKLK